MKFKKSDDQTNIDKYREVANITEYHIIPKSIFLYSKIHKEKAIISCKKKYVKISKCLNGLMDFLVTVIELLRFLIILNCIRNQVLNR